MEPRVFRFRSGRTAREAVVAMIVSITLGTGAMSALGPELIAPNFRVVPGLLLWALSWLLLWWGRWRRRYVLDDRGIELRLGSRALSRLQWEEVEELFLLNWPGFELHGAGKKIRVLGPYEGLPQARSHVVPKLTRVREHLQHRALTEGQAIFRMPTGAWKAHLSYLVTLIVLTALTGLCLAPLIKGRLLGYPILLVFSGSWLWGLRRRASILGTRVLLRPDGLVVQRLDRRDRVTWEDFSRAEWNQEDGLDLLLKSRRVISLPASLGNLGLLEELLREGRPIVDSGTTGGAESRTMMQSS